MWGLIIAATLWFDNPKYFLNVNETEVYLKCAPNRIVHPKGEETVSIMSGGSSSMLVTRAVTIAMDGRKLPFFVILNALQVEVSKDIFFLHYRPVFFGAQSKAWMDNRMMTIWYNSVIKPYISGYNGYTSLLLDHFRSHHSENFTSLLEESKVRSYKIPLHYTSLLQPCNVGIIKSLKDRLKKCASNWRR